MPSRELLPSPSNTYRPSVIMLGDSLHDPQAEVVGISFLHGIALFNPENDELQPDEKNYLGHLVMGATNTTIGAYMEVPTNTVQSRTSQLRRMIGVDERSGLLSHCLDPQVGILTLVKPASMELFKEFTEADIALVTKVAHGQSSKRIAKEENISAPTVTSRVSNLKKKIGYHASTELLAAGAVLSGIADPDAIFDYGAAKHAVEHHIDSGLRRGLRRFAVRYVR